ncbi:cytochrome P450 [Gloeopeniophorella convolvens]|nr:cytochrome P450 [Gloeopeniophorella convolvens]
MSNLTSSNALLVAGLVIPLFLFAVRLGRRRLPYPPGPKRLPIVGNLFDMPTRNEWMVYKEWSNEYGSDIVHVDVLGAHTVIVNTTKAAHELFEKRSAIYSDRPPLVAINHLIGMDSNLGFIPYGDRWRHLRREFQVHFTPQASKAYHSLQERASHRLLAYLLASPEDYPRHFQRMTQEVIMWIAYGIDVKPENDPFVEVAEKALHAATLAGTLRGLIFDMVPWLIHMPSWFPGASFKAEAREWLPYVVSMVDEPFAAVRALVATGTPNSSVAASMIAKLNDQSSGVDLYVAKGVPGTMYIAGIDTTATAMRTFLYLMTLHPEVLHKAQAEVDTVTGGTRLPEFFDEESLPYVNAVFKEVLRWHPVAPLGIPHRLIQDDVYEGHLIPAGTTVIGNIWGILRDEAVFPDADRFIPERWLGPDAPEFPDEAFGFGRRICPGRFMARDTVWTGIVGMIATFEITPKPEHPPQNVFTSGVVSFPDGFQCCIRPRSEAAAALARAAASEVAAE